MQVAVNSNAIWASSQHPEKDQLLGEIMLMTQVITSDQLDEALSLQRQKGGQVGQILINLGYISESGLKDSLERQMIVRTGH